MLVYILNNTETGENEGIFKYIVDAIEMIESMGDDKYKYIIETKELIE